jgi:hypothetical protein
MGYQYGSINCAMDITRLSRDASENRTGNWKIVFHTMASICIAVVRWRREEYEIERTYKK